MNFETEWNILRKELWALKAIKIVMMYENNKNNLKKLEKEDRVISEQIKSMFDEAQNYEFYLESKIFPDQDF